MLETTAGARALSFSRQWAALPIHALPIRFASRHALPLLLREPHDPAGAAGFQGMSVKWWIGLHVNLYRDVRATS